MVPRTEGKENAQNGVETSYRVYTEKESFAEAAVDEGVSETRHTLRISRRMCSRSTSRRAGKGPWSLPATPYLFDSS